MRIINLVAGVPLNLGQGGKEFFLYFANFPITLKPIRQSKLLTPTKGVLTGFHMRSSFGTDEPLFDDVIIESDYDQRIKVIVADYSIKQDLSVVDLFRERVEAGVEYIAGSNRSAVAANYNHHQLYNVDASKVNLVIDEISVFCDQDCRYEIKKYSTAIGVNGSPCRNMLVGSGLDDAYAERRTLQSITTESGAVMSPLAVSAYRVDVVHSAAPFVLVPGLGLYIVFGNVNVTSRVTWIYHHEAIL